MLPSHNITRLAYLGFVRPNVGAIPPMSEMQAMWWALRLKRLVSQEIETRLHLIRASILNGRKESTGLLLMAGEDFYCVCPF